MATGKKTKGTRVRRRKAQSEVADALSQSTIAPSGDGKSRIFISWSGAKSKALAQALRGWLPLVLHYAEPWLSEADIDAGERWADAVASELEASNFGIICVTRQSASAPWLLFEAGALANSLQGSVIPLLLHLEFREITGPLAQFQAKKVEQSGLLEVVRAINSSASSPVPDGRLHELFEALWPAFEKQIAAIPREHEPVKTARSQTDVLEELVGAVRSLDSRMRERVSLPKFSRRHSSRKVAFEALELSEALVRKQDINSALLVLASMYRYDAPWLYDLVNEYFRSARFGRGWGNNRALNTLQLAIDFTRTRTLELGSDDFEILMQMERILRRIPVRAKPIVTKAASRPEHVPAAAEVKDKIASEDDPESSD